MEPILTTPRLTLRELSPGDADWVADLLGDPEVMAYWRRPYTRLEAVAWIERHRRAYRAAGYGYWLVTARSSGEPVGQAGLLEVELDGRRQPGLGYLFTPTAWGKGYATEAAAAVIGWAFSVAGLARVVAPVRPQNLASCRVAEKAGLAPGPVVDFAGFPHRVYSIERRR